jgi:RNA polymerase sigma-70 factor (family 1)
VTPGYTELPDPSHIFLRRWSEGAELIIIFPLHLSCGNPPIIPPVKSYTSYDDGTLVHLLTKGDDTAFTELYDRYWKLLFYVAFKRLKDHVLAEEVVQDVFADIWLRRHSLKIQSAFKYYIAACAQYQVMAQLARRKKNALVPIAAATDPAGFTQADHLLLVKDLEEQLQQLVASLPEKCRLVYELKRGEGLTNREVADQLGISEKTVENQMTKALGRIRGGLGDAALIYVILHLMNRT